MLYHPLHIQIRILMVMQINLTKMTTWETIMPPLIFLTNHPISLPTCLQIHHLINLHHSYLQINRFQQTPPIVPSLYLTGHSPIPRQPTPQIIQQRMVNWSIFKPEFAGKPEEHAEVHLLHTNDWMWTHHFEENVKVDRFCLALLGDA